MFINSNINLKEFTKSQKSIIQANLQNSEFQLKDLVEASNMSRSKYISTFKEAFGKTPIAVVNEYRMKKAAHMIETTSYTMKRIAFEVGFTDRHYFCRCFKAFYHMTTTEYKAQVAAKKVEKSK